MAHRSVRYDVVLTQGAERDLASLCHYLADFSAPANAMRFLDQVTDLIEALAQFPDRGSHPRELLELGIKDYRQLVFKPYRLLYRVIGRKVFIDLVVDGRRDMKSVLERRLLGA